MPVNSTATRRFTLAQTQMLHVGRRRAEKRIRLLQECLGELVPPAGSTALELGCESGMVADYLAEAYRYKVRGLDSNQAAIELAKIHFGDSENVVFEVNSLSVIPFPDQSFDLVISSRSPNTESERSVTLQEIHRVLRPNGLTVICEQARPPFTQTTVSDSVSDSVIDSVSDTGLVALKKSHHGTLLQCNIVIVAQKRTRPIQRESRN